MISQVMSSAEDDLIHEHPVLWLVAETFNSPRCSFSSSRKFLLPAPRRRTPVFSLTHPLSRSQNILSLSSSPFLSSPIFSSTGPSLVHLFPSFVLFCHCVSCCLYLGCSCFSLPLLCAIICIIIYDLPSHVSVRPSVITTVIFCLGGSCCRYHPSWFCLTLFG